LAEAACLLLNVFQLLSGQATILPIPKNQSQQLYGAETPVVHLFFFFVACFRFPGSFSAP